jgi:hypothetical protein
MQLGTILLYKGQRFILRSKQPYTRKGGGKSELTIWTGQCAICEREFEQTHPESGIYRWPTRTCPEHRGTLGNPRRRQKAA